MRISQTVLELRSGQQTDKKTDRQTTDANGKKEYVSPSEGDIIFKADGTVQTVKTDIRLLHRNRSDQGTDS